jgi:hypothetical protein
LRLHWYKFALETRAESLAASENGGKLKFVIFFTSPDKTRFFT